MSTAVTSAPTTSVTLTDASDITLEGYRLVTRENAGVELTDAALERVDAVRTRFLKFVEASAQNPIYGVNVGAGDGSFSSLDESQRANYTKGLNSATSFGRPLPERVVRGIVLARMSSYLDGSSAVSAGLLQHIANMLERDLAVVPAEGTRGSGEILPLGHLFASVPEEIDLGPKESMSLVNGSPASAALAADVSIRGEAQLELATLVLALACDALNVPEEHFDEALGGLWGYEEEKAALIELSQLLRGPSKARDKHQARVSVRILPRILGAARRALDDLRRDASIALGHVGDNPVFIEDGGQSRTASNGGFHNQRVMVSVDNFTRSLADLTQLAQHLMHALYQSSEAMPDQDNLSLGVSYMVAADWSEEARAHAIPSLLSFSAVGQNDVPFAMFAAWRNSERVRECLLSQLSVLTAMSIQSLHTTQREPAEGLASFYAKVRDVFEPVSVRRDVGYDLQKLAEYYGEYTEALERAAAGS